MIIATTTMIMIQVIIVGCVLWMNPEPCPRKYMVVKDAGGELAILADIHRYCKLDYGGRFVLKDEYTE